LPRFWAFADVVETLTFGLAGVRGAPPRSVQYMLYVVAPADAAQEAVALRLPGTACTLVGAGGVPNAGCTVTGIVCAIMASHSPEPAAVFEIGIPPDCWCTRPEVPIPTRI
jgi:hypothetical protein